MKITHLKILNYRAIEHLDVDVGPAGVIAQGANGRGKTTLLRALRAGLAAQDIQPDAIRVGADRAEIQIDLDDYTVKRVITKSGSPNISVEQRDGATRRKPQTFLNELLGTSPLDPLDFYLAKPKERVAAVVAAVPTKLTDELVDEWLPTWAATQLPQGATTIGGRGGLEACSAICEALYARRTEANKALAISKGDVERKQAALAKRRSSVTAAVVLSPADAEHNLAAARAASAELVARAKRAVAQAESSAANRARVQAYRDRASEARTAAEGAKVDLATLESARADLAKSNENVVELEMRLANARTLRDSRALALKDLEQRSETATVAAAHAEELEAQASELEAAIANLAEAPPTEAELAASTDALRSAEAAHTTAREVAAIVAGERELEAELTDLEASEKFASDLSDLVDFWRLEAPKKLLAAAQGIPGLAIEGDKITLDGVSIDALSGREQMLFAVDLARRLNAKTKILVVDGLERLDPEQLEDFVRFATADNFQLVGTRVDRGDVKLVAIEPSDSAEAAQ